MTKNGLLLSLKNLAELKQNYINVGYQLGKKKMNSIINNTGQYLKQFLLKCEASYYKTMFDTKVNTVKQLWNNLYKVCNFKEEKSKNTKYTVPLLKINNDNISDPQSICNEFNIYFKKRG